MSYEKRPSVIEAPTDEKYIDALTGLPNRAYLQKILPELEMSHAGNFGMLMLDLDGFKDKNDTFGHQAGDEILKRAAHMLELFTRESDMLIARPHGDEFILILPGLDDESDLDLARVRIQDGMDDSGIPASAGGAIHQKGEDLSAFFSRTDENMQFNKEDRKLDFYSPEQIVIANSLANIAINSGIHLRDLGTINRALIRKQF